MVPESLWEKVELFDAEDAADSDLKVKISILDVDPS